MAYERREFAGAAANTTLGSGISAVATALTIADATNWPDGSDGDFFIVIDAGSASEEKVRCSSRTTTTITVASGGRGSDGTSAVLHNTGAAVRFCLTAVDLDEANAHVSNTQTNPHPQYVEVADLPGELTDALQPYLLTAGGTMTGLLTTVDIDMNGNDLIDPMVTGATDKVATATVSGSVTIDAANGGTHILTISGNVTSITVSNLASGGSLDIVWIENGTGGFTIAWPAAWYWPTSEAAATATLSTAANAINFMSVKRAGSNYYAFLAGNMTT